MSKLKKILNECLKDLYEYKDNLKQIGIGNYEQLKAFGAAGGDLNQINVELDPKEKTVVDIMAEHANSNSSMYKLSIPEEALKEAFKHKTGGNLTSRTLDTFDFCFFPDRAPTQYKDHRSGIKGTWKMTTRKRNNYKVEWLKGLSGNAAYKKTEEMILQKLKNVYIMNLRAMGFKDYK